MILVIAADEGVMPQTREHLAICRLLGVRAGLVALTKTDLTALMSLAEAGKLDPVISDILPLDQVRTAHERLASGKTRGKIVLDCRAGR